MRKSFILHLDSLCILDEMTSEQAGDFIKAIYHYQINGELPKLNFAIKMAIIPFVNQFVRDEEKYNSFIDKQKGNGAKGGRPKNPIKPNETQETQAFLEKPKKAYSVSDNDSVNVNVNDSDSKKESKKVSFKKETNTDQLFENLEISESRKSLLKDWLDYKAERKETYKPRGFKMLVKILSEYNDEIVKKSIEASIASNWSGLFPEKIKQEPFKVQPVGYKPPNPHQQPVERNEANNWGMTDYQKLLMSDQQYNDWIEYYKEQAKLQTQ